MDIIILLLFSLFVVAFSVFIPIKETMYCNGNICTSRQVMMFYKSKEQHYNLANLNLYIPEKQFNAPHRYASFSFNMYRLEPIFDIEYCFKENATKYYFKINNYKNSLNSSSQIRPLSIIHINIFMILCGVGLLYIIFTNAAYFIFKTKKNMNSWSCPICPFVIYFLNILFIILFY